MKKFLSVLTLALFSLLLVGCGDTTTANNTTNPTQAGTTTTGNSYENCTLTYAAWNLGSADAESLSIERLMLQEFEKAYPGIKVQVVERPVDPTTGGDQKWDEFLAAKASVNMLPDVFQADSIPYSVTNGWTYDCSEFTKNDTEYNSISTDITDCATYNGKVMAIPQSVFYYGALVNNTLYESKNIDAPTVESTYDELMAATKSAANHSSLSGSGVVGLEGIEHILHWLPAQYNTSYGWWTYDGEKFNLDSTEYVKTVTEYRKLRTDSTFVLEALQDEALKEGSTIVLEDIFGTTDYVNDEKILCRFVYSSEFGNFQAAIDSGKLTCDYSFIGTPVVDGVKRVPIVLDFLCVSSQSEHPYEAYLLAKWMGFGDDGYQKRLDLSEENTDGTIGYVQYPSMTGNKEQLDKFFEIYTAFTDLRSIIEAGNFIVEPVKYLPGYNEARYTGTYDADNNMWQIMLKVMDGSVNISDIKTNLNSKANELMKSAKDAMLAALNK